MKSVQVLSRVGVALAGILLAIQPAAAASLKLLLPLGRTAYQTNEQIDVSVVRSDAQALPAADLAVTLSGADGSRVSLVFPLGPAAAGVKGAMATEHLHLNGWLLRPGHYTLAATAHAATASAELDIYSHLRRSTFKNIDWGCRVQGPDMAVLGEDSMGFNLLYGDYRQQANTANAQATLRGGADYMQCCTMSGGHQMDLRGECDWSDPQVLKGGTARAAQQAFFDRTKPNALGVHFYDEPGLTWEKGSAHTVSAQLRAYQSAFGADRIPHTAVKPGDAAAEARWQQWGRWKTSFLEAAWKDARFGVEQVRPDLISATQSQYAWNAQLHKLNTRSAPRVHFRGPSPGPSTRPWYRPRRRDRPRSPRRRGSDCPGSLAYPGYRSCQVKTFTRRIIVEENLGCLTLRFTSCPFCGRPLPFLWPLHLGGSRWRAWQGSAPPTVKPLRR
jgi:hypothetical protein